MNKEIERKYTVIGGFKKFSTKSFYIEQGYLSNDTNRIVRIRLRDDKSFITIKGKPIGIERFEWEKEINLDDGKLLLKLCKNHIIEKRRYIVDYKNFTIEVDEFFGANRGLFIAEIELDDPKIIPELPAWIGQEVSLDHKYHNSQLSIKPYKDW